MFDRYFDHYVKPAADFFLFITIHAVIVGSPPVLGFDLLYHATFTVFYEVTTVYVVRLHDNRCLRCSAGDGDPHERLLRWIDPVRLLRGSRT